jgi:hypothetical protein
MTTSPALNRFNEKWVPEPNTGCWLWVGSTNNKGYGQLFMNGRLQLAHRVSYQLHAGPIPDGVIVCHKCDNPPCVNADHLFLGTQTTNMADMSSKGRHGSRTKPERVPRGARHKSRTKPGSVPRGERHYARVRPERLARGEGHGNAKLTETDIHEIRAARGVERQVDTARRFGIRQSTVSAIQLRRSWGHVPEAAAAARDPRSEPREA